MKRSVEAPEIADRLATRAADRARALVGLPPWLGRPGTRGWVWLLSALCLVLTGVLFAATGSAIARAREGLDIIGSGEGPKVVATADLYFALSDMDAQMANVLLMGAEHSLGDGRAAALVRYEQRRSDAGEALLHAAQLAEGDGTEEENVRAVMEGMNRYEHLVAQAQLISDEAGRPAGSPPEEVVRLYRQAGELMRRDLLPKAYNLTLDSGATVRSTYQENSSASSVGIALVAAAATALLASLVALQIFLRRRFRRRYNLPLAAATAGVLVLGLAAIGMLEEQAAHLRSAKVDGLDSVLSLSRARAISTGMNADQSRWLMDPGRAVTYEQNFLEDARMVVLLVPEGSEPPGDLEGYTAEVADTVPDHTAYDGRMLGLLGGEIRSGGVEGREEVQRRTLRDYSAFLRADQRMRSLAEDGRIGAAVDAHMSGEESVEDFFDRYERSLVQLTALHINTFDTAVADARAGLRGWDAVLLGACLGFAALVVLGVRPRLAEYR
ncbi:protein kinase G-activating protein GlnX [Streptomonospora halophila]|uniref:Protein kinase G-activating protein GlnX n=1 Tax=Streptomonospora halophila TaxID=427369 RepID=A0ABP9GHK9_9ACTN